MNSLALHNIVAAGRRSFKTETAKRKTVMRAMARVGNYFYAAPTREQAKRIAWEDFKALTKGLRGQSSVNESFLILHLRNGSTIHVIGMDKPERIEGTPWHGGVMDEYGNMKPQAWSNHVQPVTADTRAWVDFIGVPEGRNHYYELAEYAQHSSDPNWRFFTWKSADVLPEDIIVAAKRSLDIKTFRQEYEASFETSGAMVYYSFADENVTQCAFDRLAKTWITWDFNYSESPLACMIVQDKSTGSARRLEVVKEFVYPNTNTEEMCRTVLTFLQQQQFFGTLTITGDYAGRRRESNSSFTDYQIIENVLKPYNPRIVTRPTSSIKDRVTSLNAMLCNAEGKRRIFVDAECKAVIADLHKVTWKSSGEGLESKDKALTHASDALSYLTYNEFPADRPDVITKYR
jgi:hypothetical protein